ncbi:CobW family GTP-binding protein [Lipingzhangella rawalii]|uniref:CobW family GTP-binding protein n=1 Tax=Lipingzhangella rawalii TaxID=2055835 RepID=UPI00389937CC
MRVAVVSGLHRTARQGTVDALLTAVPRSVGVHHDFAEIDDGLVYRVTRDRWGIRDRVPVDLAHACASCTLREDLIPLLRRLATESEHELCVVETWDSVEPHTVAEAISLEENLELGTVLTAVDAEYVSNDLTTHEQLDERGLDIAHNDDRAVAEVLARQIEYPNVVVATGLPDPVVSGPLLEQLNPAAAILAPGPQLAEVATHGFDPAAATQRTNPAWAQYTPGHTGRVRTVTWTRTRPLHPERLHNALEDIVARSLRGRGRFWIASQPDTLLVWDSHSDLISVHSGGPWLASLPEAAWEMVPEMRRASVSLEWCPEVGDRRQHLAFTGVDLDAEELVARLDSCLLTDEEVGTSFPSDPFADVPPERQP